MNEQEILDSWAVNAKEWTRAIREQKIPSRTKITDDAILDAIGLGQGQSLLDLGCGEGWLMRACSNRAWHCTGVDAVREFVDNPEWSGGTQVMTCQFRDLAAELPGQEFDLLVANFSLLGEQSTEDCLAAARNLMKSTGRFLIQTLHPHAAEPPYQTGWRSEDWAAMDQLLCQPTPWFFRTLEDWFMLFERHNFRVDKLTEPRSKTCQRPGSVIFILTC